MQSSSSSALILDTNVGVLSVSGPDRVRFLQGLGTNDFEEVEVGAWFFTAFCNAKGTCLEYAHVLCTEESFKFICQSAHRATTLYQHLEKFLFSSRVELHDESASSKLVQILREGVEMGKTGEKWDTLKCLRGTFNRSKTCTGDLLFKLPGAGDTVPLLRGDHILVQKKGGCPFLEGEFGYETIYNTSSQYRVEEEKEKEGYGGVAQTAVVAAGAQAERLVEEIRVLSGRPSIAIDIEPLNATVLEAGLMGGIHFRKGCFVGNEVITKKVATKAIRRHLVGVRVLPSYKNSGNTGSSTRLACGMQLIEPKSGEQVGSITTPPLPLSPEIVKLILPPTAQVWGADRPQLSQTPALAYVKTKLAEAGTILTAVQQQQGKEEERSVREGGVVKVAGAVKVAVIVEPLRFPRFSVASSPAPPVQRMKNKGKEVVILEKEKAKEDEEGKAKNERERERERESDDDGMNAEEREAARKTAKLEALAARVATMQSRRRNRNG